jgi:hypothetical protein
MHVLAYVRVGPCLRCCAASNPSGIVGSSSYQAFLDGVLVASGSDFGLSESAQVTLSASTGGSSTWFSRVVVGTGSTSFLWAPVLIPPSGVEIGTSLLFGVRVLATSSEASADGVVQVDAVCVPLTASPTSSQSPSPSATASQTPTPSASLSLSPSASVCARSPPTIFSEPWPLEDCTASGVTHLSIGVLSNDAGGCGPEEFVVSLTSVPEGWSIVPTECHTFDLNIVVDQFPNEISWQVLTVLLCCA